MAEYNVLAGDISVLAQIRSDIKEHCDKKERLNKLSFDVNELKKGIESSEKNVRDEIEITLKKSRDAVSAGFDTAMEADREKIKKLQAERDKARLKGVRERIEAETASLKDENQNYRDQIGVGLKQNKVPKICSNKLFLSLFVTRGVKDALIFLTLLAILFLAIPTLIYFFIKGFPVWGYGMFYFLLVLICFILYKIITDKIVIPHYETIDAAGKIKAKITKNKKKIKKIEKSIKKDKSEEMYGLEDFDLRMNNLYDDINKVEGERALALEEFENTAKPDIVEEISSRDRERIISMKKDLEKKESEHTKIENLVKEQRIYISSNYEAYLGEDFSALDKLNELFLIMSSGSADTIGQAVNIYKEKRL